MVFSSITFIFCIIPLFLFLDALGRQFFTVSVRNAFLLTISLLFYTWGESTTVLILIAYGVMNYAAGRLIQYYRSRTLFHLFLAINLAGLFFYKYCFWLINLVIESVLIPLGDYSGSVLKAPSLPLGISFFTFQAMSYLIDIHRRKITAAVSLRDFMTYLCMFSQLVAGPIVRYETIADMLKIRGADRELFTFGVYRFLLGLNKKVLIANMVSPLADTVFNNISSLGGIGAFDAWIGMAAYGVQIYFDFSGYSDMAIGLGAMGGFRFDENFLRPYHASSVSDFWRRWHISLSSWFRDYLYIPLGGNRNSLRRTVFNKLTVFLLCGLWHGADVTFILWGLWHGLLLLFESVFPRRNGKTLTNAAGRAYTLIMVFGAWILFRADTLADASLYYSALILPQTASLIAITEFPFAFLALAAGMLLIFVPAPWLPHIPDSGDPGDFSFTMFMFQTLLAAFSVGLLFVGTRNPFIYFNF